MVTVPPFSITCCVLLVNTLLFGAVNTMFTVTGKSTAGLISTVHIRVMLDPDGTRELYLSVFSNTIGGGTN